MSGLPRRAVSLVEMVVSLGLVSLVIVSALHAVEGTARLRQSGYDQPRAAILARDLMAEILLKAYVEPFESPQFGPEVSEGAGHRAAFDDVDDYHGWSASPPQHPDGTLLPGLAGWSRSVSVAYHQPSAPDQLVANDNGLKAITVTVMRDGKTVAQLTALRTESWSWPFE